MVLLFRSIGGWSCDMLLKIEFMKPMAFRNMLSDVIYTLKSKDKKVVFSYILRYITSDVRPVHGPRFFLYIFYSFICPLEGQQVAQMLGVLVSI